jgi:hypothetical protein
MSTRFEVVDAVRVDDRTFVLVIRLLEGELDRYGDFRSELTGQAIRLLPIFAPAGDLDAMRRADAAGRHNVAAEVPDDTITIEIGQTYKNP